jgi:hypothetical protein
MALSIWDEHHHGQPEQNLNGWSRRRDHEALRPGHLDAAVCRVAAKRLQHDLAARAESTGGERMTQFVHQYRDKSGQQEQQDAQDRFG